MANVRQVVGQAEIDERLGALSSNVGAVQAIASAVAGTIGPKGLDTMLVDRFGDVVITNDGITILTRMEVTHPAARMAVNVARAQQQEVGDGTTTAAIMAGALLGEAFDQVAKGVPVTHVIQGVHAGVRQAIAAVQAQTAALTGPSDPLLHRVAMVAGRQHADIASLVLQMASQWDPARFADPAFRLADCIMAEEGANNEVIPGVLLRRERLDWQQPARLSPARILILDDALEPEELAGYAMASSEGFQEYMRLRDAFRAYIDTIVDLGVNLLLLDRGIHEEAQAVLTEAGVMVVDRVAAAEWRRVAEHAGARPLKRASLCKPIAELARHLGSADAVQEDERLGHIRITGGKGKPTATILVGAATSEVVGERERIAKDAAASVQAAVGGGVVAGGGAVELYASRMVDQYRTTAQGMAAHGVAAVAAALRKPLSQIVANAGFNPLEKVSALLAAQSESGNGRLGIDCETGEVADMWELGVLDPAPVKLCALRAAGEIVEAVLRIDTIIKMREEPSAEPG